MSFVTTVSGKTRLATATEQSAIDTKASLKSRKAKLEKLKQEVSGTDSSIEHKVSDIESEFQLKGDKFVDLQTDINGILSQRSSNLTTNYIQKGIAALDKEIASVESQINNIAIPTLYPDIEVKQA